MSVDPLTSVRELLGRIQALRAERGEYVQPPCPRPQIEFLKRRLREELGCELPGGYEELLLLSNGLDWNGVVLFSAGYEVVPEDGYMDIQDMVFANLALREAPGLDTRLVLGESGMDLYVQDLGDGHAAIIDSIGLHEYETFASVQELLTAVLRSSLTNFGDQSLVSPT